MNGQETHEWRIQVLERRMENIEQKIQTAMYLLVANLVGVIGVLFKALFFK